MENSLIDQRECKFCVKLIECEREQAFRMRAIKQTFITGAFFIWPGCTSNIRLGCTGMYKCCTYISHFRSDVQNTFSVASDDTFSVLDMAK